MTLLILATKSLKSFKDLVYVGKNYHGVIPVDIYNEVVYKIHYMIVMKSREYGSRIEITRINVFDDFHRVFKNLLGNVNNRDLSIFNSDVIYRHSKLIYCRYSGQNNWPLKYSSYSLYGIEQYRILPIFHLPICGHQFMMIEFGYGDCFNDNQIGQSVNFIKDNCKNLIIGRFGSYYSDYLLIQPMTMNYRFWNHPSLHDIYGGLHDIYQMMKGDRFMIMDDGIKLGYFSGYQNSLNDIVDEGEPIGLNTDSAIWLRMQHISQKNRDKIISTGKEPISPLTQRRFKQDKRDIIRHKKRESYKFRNINVKKRGVYVRSRIGR